MAKTLRAEHLDLERATSLVTGAGSGIGRAIVEALLGTGGRVIATDRQPSRLRDLEAPDGARLVALDLDVTDRDTVARLPGVLPDGWREVDVLVNCAGHDIGGRRPYLGGDMARYADIIETNLLGVMRMTHALAEGMLARGRGHVVNIGSIAGHRTEAATASYTASKHGVHGFSDSLRKDLLDSGVHVTEICPGRVRTDFGYARAESRAEADRHYDAVGQCLEPADVARAVIYALGQPAHVVIAELVLMPASQA